MTAQPPLPPSKTVPVTLETVQAIVQQILLDKVDEMVRQAVSDAFSIEIVSAAQ